MSNLYNDYVRQNAVNDEYLEHYGVKGMKWGVRRKARKDAREFATAKMYYGTGAGNRRKLIKATVEERSKDPFYKNEFDKRMAQENMAKRASQAKRQRRTTDIKEGTAKNARGLVNIANNNPQAAGATAVMIASVGVVGYKLAKTSGADKVVKAHATKTYNYVKNEVKAQRIKREFNANGWL